MELTTVNQRLKFLLDKLGLSARAFSELIGEKASNTQNYVGARNSMPGADYIEKVLTHFERVNPIWLTMGKGAPFLDETEEPFIIYQKNSSGQKIKNNHGTATNNSYTIADCEKERDSYKAQLELAQKEVELLRDQLVMKDALIAAKDETISLLRGGYNRPN